MPTDCIALATDATHASLPDDDRLLLPALATLGLHGVPTIWDDPATDWSSFDAVVIRSCWDYHLRLPEFDRWLGILERARVPVRNAPHTLRWNTRKQYLLELAARGHAVVPTLLVRGDDDRSLADLRRDQRWDDVVLKPVVSASAHDTWRVRATDAAAEGEARLRRMRTRGDVLVQPFLPEIASEGEWSLVWLGGAFSHAVCKRPLAGDFRVQAEHGGSATAGPPPADALAAATRVMQDVAPEAVYARVDGCMTASGWRLMELELVEPSLFLGLHAGAAGRFARAIALSLGAPVR